MIVQSRGSDFIPALKWAIDGTKGSIHVREQTALPRSKNRLLTLCRYSALDNR